MLHRCLSILVVASLIVAGNAAWATSVFVDISKADGYTTAIPDGVATGGYTEFQTNITGQTSLFFSPNVYSGGASGTCTNLLSTFTNAVRIGSTNMNGNAEFIGCQTSPATGSNAKGGWLYANGTATALPVDSGEYETYGVAINNSGATAGFYNATSSGPEGAFVYTGGTYYSLNGGICITALNTSGQAVGWGSGPYAGVWTYTISGGSLTAQSFTDLQTPAGGLTGTGGAYPSCYASVALAINSAGQVVIAADNNGIVYPTEATGTGAAAFVYNMNTQTYTSLGSLQIYDPTIPTGTGTQYGGHAQAINDRGVVVGRIPNGSGYDAAIWQNGTVTDLNTLYASILPSGFVLNNATAIDDNGDIAGYGTDVSNNTTQAFVIYNAVPEPGTVTLLLAGLGGLLAYAWRKRR